LTYQQLDERANRLANGLIGLGLQRGDRVGAMLPNCEDYIVFALACAKAVLCMVPVNYRFTGAEAGSQLQDSGARAFIHDASFEAQLGTGAWRSDMIQICRGGPHAGGSLETLMEAASPGSPSMEAVEGDAFYLGYTSGTTGKPKGAIITQRNRALAYHYWALEFGIRPDDIALHCGPFHHTAPFTFVLTQLFMGGTVVILDAFNGEAALKAISRYGVTWAFTVPFMLDRLLEARRSSESGSVDSLRMLISGASTLPTRTKRAILSEFPNASLHEFYGATEAGVITNLRPEDQREKLRSVGQPVADIRIEIRDDEGRPCGTGHTGHIWLNGPTLLEGYYGDPDKTREVKQGEWCLLGDVGWLDEEGFLYLVDRSKDVIKSGGVNVYPIEIEEVILQVEDVLECAVVGMADERWGESVQAFLVVRDPEGDVEARVRAVCARELAGYKCPKKYHFIESLPRNANGKVLKRVLRARGAELFNQA